MNHMEKIFTVSIFFLLICFIAPVTDASSGLGFTSTFSDLTQCKFSSTGNNPYFPLIPGSKHEYQGKEGKENVDLIITVTDKTKIIGGIETRVVKEHEVHNGELVEISFNYFATCKKDNSVFYFGEDTNLYENGVIVSHEGSWRHGVNGAQAGLVMPGIILLGSRFQQEVAPNVAMDHAEIVKVELSISTPAGIFDHAIKSKEATPLEKNSVEFKWYAPKVGLIQDDTLKLVNYSIP